MKKCITWIPSSRRLGAIVQDILLCDSSIHNTLCRIVCITTQTLEVSQVALVNKTFAFNVSFVLQIYWKSANSEQRLYVSRLYEVKEIEGLQDAVCSVIDILVMMLAAFSKVCNSQNWIYMSEYILLTWFMCYHIIGLLPWFFILFTDFCT